jgi:hypothetical protein
MDQTNQGNAQDLDARLSALSSARPDCLYYAITLTGDDEDRIIFATPTQWTGWHDEARLEELRCARLVYAQYVELWKLSNQPYAVIHTADELTLFLLGGGNALVEEKLAERIFSRILGSERSVRDGVAGFASPSLLPANAFQRAPTPKVRMQVLKRDHARCRICGRSPADFSDVVLHVHHIRPWEKGGITNLRNLITLCHTCHSGLEPHDDPSLFQYLNPKNPDEAQLREFQRGIANYRRIGFCSSIRSIAKTSSKPNKRRKRS